MSNNNNDGGAFLGIAIVGAVLYIIGLVVYALACFAALILTIIALLSWDEPLVIMGEEICTPIEARVFVGTGLVGAVGLTAFVLFCSYLFGFRFDHGWTFYLLSGGYAWASLAIGLRMGDEAKKAQRAAQSMPVIEHEPVKAITHAPDPFRYASWEDEISEQPEQKKQCGNCDFGRPSGYRRTLPHPGR